MLRLEGVEEKVERIDRFTTLADAIESFNKPRQTPAGTKAEAR